MEHTPSIDSIKTRLHRALPQFLALAPIGARAGGVPLRAVQIERSIKNTVEKHNVQLVEMSAFQDVMNWVEVHWNPKRQTRPPQATVSTEFAWVHNDGIQLDALTATFKLLLAAAEHGAKTAANFAMNFAAHGSIEVLNFYLLKGPRVASVISLDDYCNILPYSEALQKMNAASSEPLLPEDIGWPPPSADNVCVLEAISFERKGLTVRKFESRESRLLQCGLDTLMLILGLVWGIGFRVFGNWHGVAEPVAATLPFFGTTGSSSRGIRQTPLTLPGYRMSSFSRPLNNEELIELIDKYAIQQVQTKRVLNLAMRRLRDGTERMELEDRVVDVSIALEALFMEGEQWKQKKIVSRRASWHFADSCEERVRTRTQLKEFYDQRSAIVHGNTPELPTSNEEHQRQLRLSALTIEIENVVRASLKAMISEGRPQNWEDSKDLRLIRHDPPRAETDIPSVKSDSMSWTIAEQRVIDQALEAVWKPEVDNAPLPQSDAESISYGGIYAKEIERCRQQGMPYTIIAPIRLYMAHPKWPKQEGDPLDERTKYYCKRDVEKHLQQWRETAGKKRMHVFGLPIDISSMYLPERFGMWRRILQQGGQL